MGAKYVEFCKFQEKGRAEAAAEIAELIRVRVREGQLYCAPDRDPATIHYPVVAGCPGIGKTRFLRELDKLVAAQLKRPVFRIDVTFNRDTSLTPDGEDRDLRFAVASRILFDLGFSCLPPPDFPDFQRMLHAICPHIRVSDALAVWFTLSVPEPQADMLAILCVDELTKFDDISTVSVPFPVV